MKNLIRSDLESLRKVLMDSERILVTLFLEIIKKVSIGSKGKKKSTLRIIREYTF